MVRSNFSEASWVDRIFDPTSYCFEMRTTLVRREIYDLHVSTMCVNTCKEVVQNHPVRTAIIVLSSLVGFFTLVALLLMWRKRKFDQSKRSVLASKIDIESNDSELELDELSRRNEGYAQAAKLIENRAGRFEIGSDDLDDDDADL